MYLLVRLRPSHGREQDAIDVKTRAQLIIRMRSRACLVGWKTFGVGCECQIVWKRLKH